MPERLRCFAAQSRSDQPVPEDLLQAHLRGADAALAAKNPVAALREYGAALEINPNQSRAVFRMADLLHHGYPRQAEDYYRRYINLEPADPWGPISFADFLDGLNRSEEAFRLYEKSVAMDPTIRDAILGYARAAGRTDRTDLAIQIYRAWLTEHETDYDAWTAISGQYWRAGRPAEAWNALARVPNKDHIERLDLYDRSAAPALVPMVGSSLDTRRKFPPPLRHQHRRPGVWRRKAWTGLQHDAGFL